MKISYDKQVNAAYIRLLEGTFECTTIRLSDDVAINMAPDGKVVGIEILDASRNLRMRDEQPTLEIENLLIEGLRSA